MTRPPVVAVSGHMVDAPDRPTPRFPPDQVARVTDEIREALRRFGVGPGTVVLCGGARGADIIGAEEGLALGARVGLRLAQPPADLEDRSVDLPGTDWVDRFRALLGAAEVKVLAEEVGDVPDDDAIYARTNEWIVDEATSLAGGRPYAVVVWDGAEGDGVGGAADFVRRLGHDGPDESLVVIDPRPPD